MLNEVNSALANQLRKATADSGNAGTADARAVADNQAKTDFDQQAAQRDVETAAAREQQKVSPQESHAQLREAVSRISDYVQKIERTLQFSVDEQAERTVIRVINSANGELVRQIPSEEALALSAAIAESREIDPTGLLFKTDV